MIVKSEHIPKLKLYIKNIEELIALENIQEVLDAIDDVIVDNILQNGDEPNNEGIILQKIYDDILVNN